jgi:hypothetical protein
MPKVQTFVTKPVKNVVAVIASIKLLRRTYSINVRLLKVVILAIVAAKVLGAGTILAGRGIVLSARPALGQQVVPVLTLPNAKIVTVAQDGVIVVLATVVAIGICMAIWGVYNLQVLR